MSLMIDHVDVHGQIPGQSVIQTVLGSAQTIRRLVNVETPGRFGMAFQAGMSGR